MPDIYNIPGGRKTPNFHPDYSIVVPLSLPKTVAGEFGRGDFTLGVPFVPSLATRQADALSKLTIPDPFAPFVMWLQVVPEEHSTDSLGIRVEPDICGEPDQIRCVPPKCGWTDPAGFTFNIVRQNFDNAIIEAGGTMEDAKIGSPTVVGATPKNLDAYEFQRVPMAQHVPTGESMLIGIQILTPPDAGADRIAGLQCRVTAVAKVHDYANPLQIM